MKLPEYNRPKPKELVGWPQALMYHSVLVFALFSLCRFSENDAIKTEVTLTLRTRYSVIRNQFWISVVNPQQSYLITIKPAGVLQKSGSRHVPFLSPLYLVDIYLFLSV